MMPCWDAQHAMFRRSIRREGGARSCSDPDSSRAWVRQFDARDSAAAATGRQCRFCLTGKVRSGCLDPLCERDVVSEAFELVDEASGLAFGVAGGEVVAAEVVVGLAGGQHVPDRAEHAVLDGAERLLVSTSRLEALVLGGEGVARDADRGHRCLFERVVEPFGAVAGLVRAALAGRLIVAGAAPGP